MAEVRRCSGNSTNLGKLRMLFLLVCLCEFFFVNKWTTWVCFFTIVEWNPPFNGVGDDSEAGLVLCDG